MNLKPQDVLVLLKLVAIGKIEWSYNSLALALGMSPSEVHAAVQRAVVAGLAVQMNDDILPSVRGLREFLVHGLKYVFVPEHGAMTRGVPTSYAASPLEEIIVSDQEPPPVWPDPNGDVRGVAFSPIYKSVPKAVASDKALYELLVLVDAIRGGRAREREIAVKELKKRLEKYEKTKKSKP